MSLSVQRSAASASYNQISTNSNNQVIGQSNPNQIDSLNSNQEPEKPFLKKATDFSFKGFFEKLASIWMLTSLVSNRNNIFYTGIAAAAGFVFGHLVAIGEEKILELMGEGKGEKGSSFGSFLKSWLVKTPVFLSIILSKCFLLKFTAKNEGFLGTSGQKLAEEIEKGIKFVTPELDSVMTASKPTDRINQVYKHTSDLLDKESSNNFFSKIMKITFGASTGLDRKALSLFMALPYQSWGEIFKILTPFIAITTGFGEATDFLFRKILPKPKEEQETTKLNHAQKNQIQTKV